MVSNQRNGPRFRVDDFVYYSAQNSTPRSRQSSERFVVAAVMPPDRAGSYQYRIRPTGSGPQRIASELELRR
jgi:hypothetical protein